MVGLFYSYIGYLAIESIYVLLVLESMYENIWAKIHLKKNLGK